MTNLIPETRIAKRWFVFETFEPATVIFGVSDMSMVWNPQSMNIITAHEPAAVIISRFWYIHGTGPLVCTDLAEQTSGECSCRVDVFYMLPSSEMCECM
ncbi:hypothetical protein DPMN_158700 [Dreissena polymorpha]|uniref:Uncharacterized protein n=1 Tax=Dreissena polymorpha TaxID=45954 RepID=A0A9D4INF9_DREPO|nr:hypothetical protein DPMN_158700 [Dreissena polymorpha]